MSVPAALSRAVASRAFQRAQLALILGSAALVGLETSPALVAAHAPLFRALDTLVLALFTAELAVRLLAHGARPLGFLRSPWNVFDLVLVVLAYVPAVGPLSTVARLARVLRVLRLVSAAPQLRLIVETMLRSIPSLGYVTLLLGLLLYVYAVVGVKLFAAADPEHWGSLGAALVTLFGVLTLEGWVELQRTAMNATPLAWIYFSSFVLVAVFVMVNLFVAVVLNNLEEARADAAREAAPPGGAPDFAGLRRRVDALEAAFREAEGAAGRRAG
jgi:voltage-gated sodium channel